MPQFSFRLLVFAFLTFSLVAAFPQGQSGSHRPVFSYRPSPGHALPPLHMMPFVTASPTGLSPAKVRNAYGFNKINAFGGGQTIGIVDAFDDPNVASDLAHFSSTFGLPQCTTSNGCFRKIYGSGSKPLTDPGWSLEIAVD